jgi:hypothetical protein
MNKRILKRHQRQVARARHRVRLSQPGLRTAEQLTAAREVSRSIAGRHSLPYAHYAAPPIRIPAGPETESAAKADEQ